MHRPTALLWWHLNVLNKTRFDAMREVYGSLEEATKHLSEAFLRSLGVREETTRAALLRLEEFDAARSEAVLLKEGIGFLTIEDEQYPEMLRKTADPPVFLSYKGDLACLHQPLLALVGTRTMSPYGKRVAELFTEEIVRAGVVTVSGLALGIDTVVAKETLKAGGRTVAVLGSGLKQMYPSTNKKLAEDIVKNGGLLLSEFPVDLLPSTITFPARNRIIAGLARGTIVLEAPEGSGALITADFALDEGRDVFVVPGQIFDPNYAGCHALLAKGTARLVRSPDEVLEEIGVISPSLTPKNANWNPGSDTESHIWEALTTLPQTVDHLVERTKMSAAEVGTALTMMEVSGVVKKVGAGEWVRI